MTNLTEVDAALVEQCLIWSGEHEAYWRPNGNGYTVRMSRVGVFTRSEAERIVNGCGPEKKLEIERIEALRAPDDALVERLGMRWSNNRWRNVDDYSERDAGLEGFEAGYLAALTRSTATTPPAKASEAMELLRRAMNILGCTENDDPLEPIADNGMTVWDGMRTESEQLWKRYRALAAAPLAAQEKPDAAVQAGLRRMVALDEEMGLYDEENPDA